MNDNIIAIMRHFNPEGWEAIVNQIVDRSLSIMQGVGQLFQLLPTSMMNEVIDYAISNAIIRPGFADLLQLCKDEGIEFLVTSGGIDFFVYPILAEFGIPKEHIYCNQSDFNGDHILITWPNPCDGQCTNECGMCKPSIIRKYPTSDYYHILIGDSITDFEGAKIANQVYARSHLIDRCAELQIAYTPFETFFDVITHLQTIIPTTKS